MKGGVARLQARVLGQRAEPLSSEWLAAIARGEAEAAEACSALAGGIAAPSATPYLDLAFRGGAPEDWGIDLSGARALRWPEMRRLLEGGVDARLAGQLNGGGDLMTGRIAISGDGARFAFGGAEGRLLLVVRDQRGAPVDAIAFTLDQPRGVASLLEDGDGLLGAWNLPQPGEAGRVAMFETPLDWLRGGGRGLCVYDWPRAVGLLRSLGELVTLEAAPALAAVLRAKLERSGLPMVASALPADAKLSLAERIGRSV